MLETGNAKLHNTFKELLTARVFVEKLNLENKQFKIWLIKVEATYSMTKFHIHCLTEQLPLLAYLSVE